MEEPMPLRYVPSATQSIPSFSFISDDSLLEITPEKPSAFKPASFNSTSNKFDIDNRKPNKIGTVVQKDACVEDAYLTDQVGEVQTHDNYLQTESTDDLLSIPDYKRLEALENLKCEEIIKKYQSIKNDSSKSVCRGSKVTFDRDVAVHCFSPEESNTSHSSDSTINDSLSNLEYLDNLTSQSSSQLESAPSFYHMGNYAKRLTDSSKSINDQSIYKQSTNYTNFLTNNSFLPNTNNNYGLYSPNRSFDNNKLNDHEYDHNQDAIFNESFSSPLNIPAVDLSVLSIGSNDSVRDSCKDLFNAKCTDTDINYSSSLKSQGINDKTGFRNSGNNDRPVFVERKDFDSIGETNDVQDLDTKSIVAEKPYDNGVSKNKTTNSASTTKMMVKRIFEDTKPKNSKAKIKASSKVKSSKDGSTANLENTSSERIKENVLLQAHLNSTLALKQKLVSLKEKKFDDKTDIDPKIVFKAQEKALSKLNIPLSDSTYFNLPSLDVDEAQLRLKKSQQVSSSKRPAYLDKPKINMDVKHPELLDFYTDSLFPQPFHLTPPLSFLPAPKGSAPLSNTDACDDIFKNYIKFSNYQHL